MIFIFLFIGGKWEWFFFWVVSIKRVDRCESVLCIVDIKNIYRSREKV